MTRRRVAFFFIWLGAVPIGLMVVLIAAASIAFLISFFFSTSFIVGVRVLSWHAWAKFALPFALVLMGVLLLWREKKAKKSN